MYSMSQTKGCITPEFKKGLEELQQYLIKKVKYLNCGGCIRFAYYFSEYLTYNNIQHKIVFASPKKINFNLKHRNKLMIYHVLVYIPTIGYIDGHDTRSYADLDYYFIKQRKLKLEQLAKWMTKKKWNNDYKLFHDKTILRAIKLFLP